jgi:TetR/AcrR family transcriptional repressor of lmrAB and yxaGH operons
VPNAATGSKIRMVLATLDLLRTAGLTGAALNDIVVASGAPKGSLYHFFPGGKDQLVTAALREAERAVGEGFRAVFNRTVPLSQKVNELFGATASRLAASGFTRGCPVGAVTLDLDGGSEQLQAVCRDIFRAWCTIIESGLAEVPPAKRGRVAQLILATLEGGLILSRARADKAPLRETGAFLAETFDRAFGRTKQRARATRTSSARTRPRRSR